MELFSVLVTGANRGIGLEFVWQLTQLKSPPSHLFATHRHENTIQELLKIKYAVKKTTEVHLIKLDVRYPDEIYNLVKIVDDVVKEKGLTLLINNAGAVKRAPFLEITKDLLDFHFSTNTVGPILITQVMYPLLKRSAERFGEQGLSFSRAGILNMSSLAGSIANAGVEFVRDLAVVPYKISKAALNMSVRAIAVEAKKDNIMVIAMCPGWVKTDMTGLDAPLQPKESIAAMLDTICKLNETHTGTYVDRHGNPIPY